MSFSHITFAGAKNQLAARLGDSGMVFWTDTELGLYIIDALRTFNSLTGYFRGRDVYSATAGAFSDLHSALPAFAARTVTDRDLVTRMQYMLIEPATGSSWTGTDMFTLDQVAAALQRRRDQFLSETGCVISRSTHTNALGPPDYRYSFSTDNIIAIRRAAIRDIEGEYYPLWRSDESSFFANPDWAQTPSRPESFSILSTPPLTIQLNPPPNDIISFDFLLVTSGSSFNPSALSTVVGIPDDLCWGVMFGALADLLTIDEGRDPLRAQFCEQRYQQAVALSKQMPAVLGVEVDGVRFSPSPIGAIDAGDPSWQGKSSRTPASVGLIGSHYLVFAPTLSQTTSVLVDMVRKAIIPSADGDLIQIGREVLDAVIGYAQHLALFKVGGAEWAQSQPLSEEFARVADRYNSRLRASSLFAVEMKLQQTRELTETRFESPDTPQPTQRGRIPE